MNINPTYQPAPAPKMSISFDEADIDMAALQGARQAMVKSLIMDGVTDLNQVTPGQLDKASFVLLMVYFNRIAQRNFGYGLVSWAAHYQGVPIPFFDEARAP